MIQTKKIFNFFLFSCFFSSIYADFTVSNDVEAAILMNAENGKVLFEKNAKEKKYPASVTKIATAIYAIEKHAHRFQDVVLIDPCVLKTATNIEKKKFPSKYPAHTLEPDGSSISLIENEKIPFLTLLYGLMLGSGNDAANAIAFHCEKDISSFMQNVNFYLKSIGCKSTQFLNPHGLHHEMHYTTALDLAIMAKKALQNPTFAQIVKSTSYLRPDTNKQKAFTINQTNKLLRQGSFYYPQAYGVKTGYTSSAGYNLVSAAANEKRNLIAVVLGCKSSDARFKESTRLFEEAFNEKVVQQRLFAKGADVFKTELSYAKETLKAVLNEDVDLSYYPSEKIEFTTKVNWLCHKLPIYPDQVVGAFELCDASTKKIILRKNLVATNFVDYKTSAKIKMKMNEIFSQLYSIKYYMIAVGILFASAFYVAKRSRIQSTK
jgi:D-alanyl-D-alanine carboxypeptidase (penicillin-binding protein 5/6)